MLSSRNEWIVVGLLIIYLAFIPSLQMIRDVLSTSVGKAAALAAIVYVHKYISCPVALLLVIAYVRCARTSREMFTTPTTTVQPTMSCPNGYAYDSVSKECKPSSSMSGSVPPSPTELGLTTPINTMPPTSGAGAPIDTTPGVGTVPMTTPMPTMPSMTPMTTSGGVQPSMGSSSSAAPL
jgi:hypothetical protein